MSLKQEIKDLQKEVSEIRAKANIKEQGNAMAALLSEVREFAEAIESEKKLVSNINELRKKVASEANNPEDEKDYAEAREMLNEAESLQLTISQKKSMLRKILNDVNELRTYLGRVVN